jgi:capsular exopolysaccharide synthesis family protein
MNTRPQLTEVEGPKALTRAEAAYRIEPEPNWIDFGDIWAAIHRNIWLILLCTAVTVGIAAYMVSRQVVRYNALAVIRLIDRNPGVETQAGAETPLGGGDPLESELMVLRSRNVVGRAVDRGGFRIFDRARGMPVTFLENPEVTLEPEKTGIIRLEFTDAGIAYGPESDRRTAKYGERIAVEGARFTIPKAPRHGTLVLQIVPRDMAIDHLTAGLQATPVEGTGGVNVGMSSLDPGIPAPAANAVVYAYQEVNAELARESIIRRRTFLEEQLRTTDSLMMVAQAGLSGFRASEQAYSASGRFTSEQGNLITVEIEQARLQADLTMYQGILNRILEARSSGQGGDVSTMMSLPGLAGDPVAGPLYSQLVQYRSEREGLLAGPWARAATHPDIRRLDILIASTDEQLVEAVRSRIASLQAQINSLGALRGRALSKMSELPRTEVQEVYLTQNVSALQQMGDLLRDQYQAVRLEEAAEGGMVEIVQLATAAYPIPVSPWNKLFLGLVAGLMLGAGISLIREKLDHSINRPEDIEEALLIPNLAVIPAATAYLLEPGTGNGSGSRSPSEPAGAEAYRILRTNLMFSQGELKTLVVTSAAPGEGKTMTAVNLSAAIARQGRRVLLMECDLRRPSLKRFFEPRADTPDLSDILLEDRSWREAVHPSGVPGLDLLLANHSVPRAAESLAGPEMKNLLEQLSVEYDMVILDTSPLLVAADATVLGAIVDGVLLVVRATQTDRQAVQQAMHHLNLVGARVVGTVLNDPDGAVGRYGTYYDYSAAYESE